MLFNSHLFVFAFLPATLAIYFALGKLSRDWALRWIIVASLIFYAWWRPGNVFIILPAILFNFLIAKSILHCNEAQLYGRSRLLLIIGILFDILFLGYFKYTNFALTSLNDLFASNFALKDIVLPLGISFITFQKIAFLVDVHGKRITAFRFQDFCSFILFFPQLVAGPIVHYREMMPQFQRSPCAWRQENIVVGLTLFSFGLFKKVVLADGIAPLVSAIFLSAESGTAISLLPAWLAAIGFTLQIYFDFSGYSDMALGAARLFGIRLPVNFNSPLRSSNIIDFWLRWHVSLTRFLTAYVYNPIALHFTRRRMHAGKPGFGGPSTSAGAFLQLIMLPTVFTMFVSGIWHGAGYLFIVWGLLHGVYLAVNHAWRLFAHRLWKGSDTYHRIMGPVGFLLTFVAVVISMVIFRATTVDSAVNLLSGMFGANGIQIPTALANLLAPLDGVLSVIGVTPGLPDLDNVRQLCLWLALMLPIALMLPNTLQIMYRYEPALGFTEAARSALPGPRIQWNTSFAWLALVAVIAFLAVSRIGGYTEFLYWQF